MTKGVESSGLEVWTPEFPNKLAQTAFAVDRVIRGTACRNALSANQSPRGCSARASSDVRRVGRLRAVVGGW